MGVFFFKRWDSAFPVKFLWVVAEDHERSAAAQVLVCVLLCARMRRLDLLLLSQLYLCLYGRTYSKSMDQQGKVASPARGQLNRKNEYFPVRVRA